MEKAKKKRIRKYIAWICLAALVAGLAVMPLLARQEEEAEGPVASVLSDTVKSGSVESSLRGGGNLAAGNAEDVKLPSGVKITEFLVTNSQFVTEGTPLASVDKVSVMTAITQVQETMDYLREEMMAVTDETVSAYVTAKAGGRIKEVYAEAGDSVQDVMLEHGALAVLSLSGKMAVSIERKMDIPTGDTVWVRLPDDTEVSGRVESNLNGVIVIAVEDEGYDAGETVIVTTEDGDRVGSGQLYIHNAWKATAFTGTISSVSAKDEATVSSGSTLFLLKDTEFTAQLESLSNKHREYEELMTELMQMYQTGYITAPCDGVVSGVDKDSAFLLSALQGEEGWYVDLLRNETAEEPAWTVMLLSNVVETACTKAADCSAAEHEPDCLSLCTGLAGCPAQAHVTGCLEVCTNSDSCQSQHSHAASCIKLCTMLESCTAQTHYDSCLTHCDENEDCDANNHTEDCPWYSVTYTAQAGMVFSAGTTELIVYMDTATVYTVTAVENGWSLVEPATLNTDLMITQTILPAITGTELAAGDIVLVVTAVGTDGEILKEEVALYQSASTDGGTDTEDGTTEGNQMGGLAGMIGSAGNRGGMTGLTGGGTAQEETFQLFDLEGSVLMTVTEQTEMTLTITLDEQDIAKVSVGQAAEVKVEALRGQTFEAVVTEVGISGTSNGGSSKFTVELSMPMAENMLDGMSATAITPLYSKMDVLTIPVAALVEDGTKTVVYTALDGETGEPAAPVEVTVGISDGITAELISGLENGDTFYYSYYDTLELSTQVESAGISFGR